MTWVIVIPAAIPAKRSPENTGSVSTGFDRTEKPLIAPAAMKLDIPRHMPGDSPDYG